jgi:hypothetical protein
MPTCNTARCAAGAAAVALFITLPAKSETCDRAGADIITGDIFQVGNVLSAGGIEAFSIGTLACNAGSLPLDWFASTPHHPVIAHGLFRLRTVDGVAQFEQIGLSWVTHEFFALSQATCCTDCEPTNGQTLGVRCSSPLGASYQGAQLQAAPRSDINAFTGAFPFPPSNPPFEGSVARRLQAHISDLDPQVIGSATFFVESQYIHPNELLSAMQFNNVSWRRVLITGSGAAWSMSLHPSATVREQAAIHIWAANAPGVLISEQSVPQEGLFLIGSSATEVEPGRWHYEYAVQNVTSDRSARSISVPADAAAKASAPGFHDVDYHDGDGAGGVTIDGTDWAATINGSAVMWQTQSWDENINANALRWGTMYNFRFDAAAPPVEGVVTLGLFKPGVADSILLRALVPATGGGEPCPADCASPADDEVGIADLLALLAQWSSPGGAACDLTGDDAVDIADLLALLAAWGDCN